MASKRYTTTKDERINQVLEKGNPTHSSKNKLSEYLSQPNVKAFNSIVTSKNFECIKVRGYPRTFKNRDECSDEIEEYFKLCYNYDMIPTIASLCLFIGINRDTLYNIASNPKTYEYYDIVKSAIDTCHSYQESAVLSGDIPSVPFIFLAKNYYNLKDQTDVRFNQDIQDNSVNNTNTMQVIKDQIESEKSTQLLQNKE